MVGFTFSDLDLPCSGRVLRWDFKWDLLPPSSLNPVGVGSGGILVLPCKPKLAAFTLKMRLAVIHSILYAGSMTFEFLAISHRVSLEQYPSILGSVSG